MKNKTKEEYKKMFSFGAILVGVGVVFLTSVNKPLGISFIAIGGLFMIAGAKEKNK